MTDDAGRKPTVQVPAAANQVLQEERLRRLEAFAEQMGELPAKVDSLLSKFDLVLTKLEAQRSLSLDEARKREQNDERLGRSIDRLSEDIRAVARIQGKHAEVLGEVRALAVAAVDGVAGLGERVAALESPSAEASPHAQSAE